MDVIVEAIDPVAPEVEVVEHKGVGHPDTICDALAEEVSVALSRFYLERFGRVLHHNVDKALLFGGVSEAHFGGGHVHEPMELSLAGRVTSTVDGVVLPVKDIAHAAIERWLRANLRHLDLERHMRVRLLFRAASADLSHLFGRGLRANDTSCGVGFAPPTRLERLVLEIAAHLRSRATSHEGAAANPAIGDDIKIMAVRTRADVALTVACAFVAAHVSSLEVYVATKRALEAELSDLTRRAGFAKNEVTVNAADDESAGSVYLTVTGLSAESGDDGQVGRGNRVGGLITPGRPMTLEAAAGKNPVTHVGKLYNVAARSMARAIAREVPEVERVEVTMVSRIGAHVDDPQVVDVRIQLTRGSVLAEVAPRVRRIAEAEAGKTSGLWSALLDREIRLF